MESLRKQAANLLREQKKYRRWLAVFLCLAILVTSGTIASLMMKGQALNKQQKVLECHLVVHGHTAECYKTDAESGEQKLACGYADYVVHVHGDECRDEEGAVVCGLPEAEAHVHEEGCFESKSVLVCTEPETQGHIHTEECRTLICGKEESQGHVHAEGCKTLSQGALICENAEEGHEHVPECWEQTETITCGLEEGAEAHAHTEECYNLQGCGLAEGEGGHAHTLACYEIRQSVICGKLELHTHVKEGENSCCDTAGNLICGIPELKEHVHGDDCFRVVEEEKQDETDNAGAEEESQEDKTAQNLPSEDKTVEGDTAAADSEKETSAESQEEAETEADSEEEQTVAAGTDQNSGGENSDMESADTSAVGEKYTLTAGGEDYTVTVTYGADAQIPEGTELNVREILEGTEEYDDYYQQMLAAVDSEKSTEVSSARFFDITFLSEGEKIEPNAPVDICVSYQDAVEMGEGANASAVHFAKDGTEILDAEVVEAEEGSDFAFTQSSFSVSGIIITDDPEPFMEGTLEVQEGDYKITVTYDAEAEIPQNAVLTAEEIGMDSGAYDSYYQSYAAAVEGMTISQARFFTLSLTEEAGNPIAAKTPVNVKIQYDAPVVFADSEIPAMAVFAQVDASLLGASSVEAESQTDSFEAAVTFDGENAVVAGTVVAGVPADEEIMAEGNKSSRTPVDSYLESEGDNDWQIVTGEFVDRTPNDKILSDDKKVRVQKNVIPTDKENEFLVYLSIDVYEIVKNYFEMAEYGATQPPNKDKIPGHDYPSIDIGNTKVVVSTKPISGGKSATFTIYSSEATGKQLLAENVRLYWGEGSNPDNCTIFMKVGSRYIMIGSQVVSGATNQTIVLSEDAEKLITKTISEKVSLGTVEDIMGEYMICQGIVAGDYDQSTIWDERKIQWVPVVKPDIGTKNDTGSVQSTWSLNVAELVYKVKLDVSKDGFNSCADNMRSTPDTDEQDVSESYPLNELKQPAVLTYDDGKKMKFPIPQVRGLLYDHELAKKAQDKDGNDLGALPGAEFTATGIDGDGKGKTYTAISNQDGKVLFANMPWGTYELQETQVPEDYEKSEEPILPVRLCYTEDQGKTLVQDITNEKRQNMIQSGQKTQVINKKLPEIILRKVWIDNENKGDTRPKNNSIEFELTYKVGQETVPPQKILLEASNHWEERVTLPSTAEIIDLKETDIPINYAIVMPEENSGALTVGDAVVTNEDGIQVYTITNKIKGQKVEVLKVAGKKDGDGRDVLLPGAEFQVYDRNPDEVGENNATLLFSWPLDMPADEKEDGLIFRGDLDVGVYWLKETKQPEGYGLLEKSVKMEVGIDQVTVEGDAISVSKNAENGMWAVKITNKLKEQRVKILKKDAEGESVYLDGAVFNVYKVNPAGGNATPEEIWHSKTEEDQKGLIFEGKLDVGTYWLEVTKAPDGYNLLTEPVTILVTPEGVSMGNTITPDDNGVYIIEISNSAGFELPETGSIGTNPYTIGGAMLATAAAFLMYGYSMRRRKSERRSK